MTPLLKHISMGDRMARSGSVPPYLIPVSMQGYNTEYYFQNLWSCMKLISVGETFTCKLPKNTDDFLGFYGVETKKINQN